MSSLLGWIGQRIGLTSTKFWASFYGADTWAGMTVTPEKAMAISAVWRAVHLYAGTISSLPLNVYRDTEEPSVVRGGEYDLVLRVSPNSDDTPMEFWEAMVGARFLVGNSFAEKVRVDGRLVSMQILPPTQTAAVRLGRDKRTLRYRTVGLDGVERELLPEDVLHLRGARFIGDMGMSPVAYGANSLGTTMAADKVAGKIFKSGLSSSGFIETQQTLEEEDRTRMEKIFSDYMGSDNVGKMMLLEGGMTYKPITMSAHDAQLLLSRGFNIEEVGRWFGMPPVLLGHNPQGQTMWGTGTESLIRAWYQLGLRSELRRIEDAIRKRVFSDADRQSFYCKFNVDALLRGDSAAQAALFSAAVQNGWMSRAEVRKLLELPYIPGSDALTAQVNLVPLDKLGEESAEPNAQAAAKAFRSWLGLEAPLNVPALPAPSVRPEES